MVGKIKTKVQMRILMSGRIVENSCCSTVCLDPLLRVDVAERTILCTPETEYIQTPRPTVGLRMLEQKAVE